MSIVSFPNDGKKYLRYKKGNKVFLRCAETRKDENDNLLECNFKNVREDNYKKRQSPHTCEFVKPEQTNMITSYFQQEKAKIEIFRIEDLLTKIAMLTGQMNLPLSFCESEEFYDFVTYCFAFGASVLDQSKGDLQAQAKAIFPQYKRTFYHDLFVKTASSVHLTTLQEFKKLDYVCCAIDQGTVLGRKSVDFVLENPFSPMEAYPYYTAKIEDQTAEGYFEVLNEGLGNLELHGIRLGSVVADGNRAQKKCFDANWSGSLRRASIHQSLKSVVFIPCLCHRVDNALKYHASHDDGITPLIGQLHELAQQCRHHKELLGAICPNHISTR